MKYLFLIISLVTIALFALPADAGRGCCSWHGGQAYCGSSGYWMCNDGTRSPTCTCAAPAPLPRVQKPIPTPAPTSPSTEKKPLSVEQKISDEVASQRGVYQKAPYGFRERFLGEMTKKYGESYQNTISFDIYTSMQDIL